MNCLRNFGGKFNLELAEADAIFKNIRTAYGPYLKRSKNVSLWIW